MLDEPRYSNPIILETSNDEGKESSVTTSDDTDTRLPEQARGD